MFRSTAAVLAVVAIAILAGCTPSTGSRATTTPKSISVTLEPPAGKLIFRRFIDSAETTGALFSSNTDGSHEAQLTKPAKGEIDSNPDWSPDGTRVVFNRYLDSPTGGEVHQIEVMNSDGTGITALTPGTPATGDVVPGFDDYPVFSRDGKQIVFAHSFGSVQTDEIESSQVWVMNADGSGKHLVHAEAPYYGDVDGFAWSPDGTQLLYDVLTSSSGKPASAQALFIVNADGSANHQVSADLTSGDGGNPDWSAATNKLIFRAAPDEESGVGNIVMSSPDGTNRATVTSYQRTVLGHRVSFSPDGTWIVYGVNLGNGIHLAVAKVDGSVVHILHPKALESSAADWSPVG
jgi:TolB protein